MGKSRLLCLTRINGMEIATSWNMRIVIMLTFAVAMASSVAGYSQPPAPPPKDTEGFFHNLIGDWIGTANEYTGKIKAHTKYFHAVVRQTSPHTYEASFEYYEFDKQVGAPVQVGLTSITTHITPDGLATNTIAGQGNVFVDPKTTKHEKYQLSELLRMSLSGSLQGKGSGKIVLVPNRIGKVSDYTSTWRLDNGVLSISEHLEATFRVLFFARHYERRLGIVCHASTFAQHPI
jgi:hypothetical protein